MSLRTLRRTLGAGAAALLVTVALVSPGCDSADLQKYCEEVASCEGLNDEDTEACVVVEETREYIDSDLGCGDEHVAYYDCLLEKGTCAGEQTGQGCQSNEDCFGGQCTTNMVCENKRFTLEGEDCKAERKAYNSCSID